MKTFLVINFQRLINAEIIRKELIQSGEIQRESGSVPKVTGTDFFSQEMTNNIEAHFQCRHLQQGHRLLFR